MDDGDGCQTMEWYMDDGDGCQTMEWWDRRQTGSVTEKFEVAGRGSPTRGGQIKRRVKCRIARLLPYVLSYSQKVEISFHYTRTKKIKERNLNCKS